MITRNPHFTKLAGAYLFPEVSKRCEAFKQDNPNALIISLGIGDTPGPLTPHIAKGFLKATHELATPEGFTGYGPYEGIYPLRKQLAEVFYPGLASADEIYVSDGAKCDIGRLQVLFGAEAKIAVQDPVYPVYVDTSVVMGQTGHREENNEHYDRIRYLRCTPENAFFPELPENEQLTIIYFCSPNNPTGACATRSQLQNLVAYAKKNHCLIVFDSAYSAYIQDRDLPRSIYEIEGAREVAIEVGSFSKMANFTGIRLGWTVIPTELSYSDGTPLHKDWRRLLSIFYNGSSNIVQRGAMAVLEKEGMREVAAVTRQFLDNASILKEALTKKGIAVYGGDHCPYLWAHFPGEGSWNAFQRILSQAHVLTTPGVGFGPSGEDFIRFSAFGKRETIKQAVERLCPIL